MVVREATHKHGEILNNINSLLVIIRFFTSGRPRFGVGEGSAIMTAAYNGSVLSSRMAVVSDGVIQAPPSGRTELVIADGTAIALRRNSSLELFFGYTRPALQL